jgi:hypothetical protein
MGERSLASLSDVSDRELCGGKFDLNGGDDESNASEGFNPCHL